MKYQTIWFNKFKHGVTVSIKARTALCDVRVDSYSLAFP